MPSSVGSPATPAGIQHQFRYKSKRRRLVNQQPELFVLRPSVWNPALDAVRFLHHSAPPPFFHRSVFTAIKKNFPAVCRNGRRSAVFGPDSSSSAARQRDMASPGRFWIPLTTSAWAALCGQWLTSARCLFMRAVNTGSGRLYWKMQAHTPSSGRQQKKSSVSACFFSFFFFFFFILLTCNLSETNSLSSRSPTGVCDH